MSSEPEASTSNSDARIVFTDFATAQLAGDGDDDPKLSGKVDAYFVIDGRDLGLGDGLTVNIHPEVYYGRNFNDAGSGALTPVNTALYRSNGKSQDFDMAVNFTQRIGGGTLTLGKMNMFEKAQGTPIIGGGGLDGFQHLQFAAPASFNTPAYAFGGLLSLPVGGLGLTLGLWDAKDATGRTGFEDPFETGVSGFATLTVPARIGGRQGWYGFTFGGYTNQSTDLDDLPEIILPPAGGAVISERSGGWQLKFSFQQYLWQDAADPSRGWGLFGYVTLWDGNPTPARWAMAIGAAGTPPIASRPRDKFGVGYYYLQPSDPLIDGLAPIVSLGVEQGIETFYTASIGEVLRLTGHVQVIDPSTRTSGTAIYAGVRTQLRF